MASEWPRLGDIEYGDCEIGTGPLFRFAVVDSPDVLFVTDKQARDLRQAITAALGDGALVVTRGRLRYALEYACHWGMQQNRSQPWAQFVTAAQSYADATIAELTAPEVER